MNRSPASPRLQDGVAGNQAMADATAPMVIRRARPEEAVALTELSLRSKAVWGYEPSFMARCRAAMTLKVQAIERHPHYVAEADGALLGFYGLEPEADGVGLDYLFVAPEAIGRGVGRALWEHAVATARRLGYACLVVVSDPNAEGFYRRMGARPAGARASELQPGRSLPVLRFPLC